MSDRLSELRRQRALIEEHLAWLDREIAAESPQSADEPSRESRAQPAPSGTVPQAQSASGAPQSVPLVPAGVKNRNPTSPGNTPANALAAEALLDEYRTAPDTLRQDVRKGCLVYFALAFLVLFAAVGILWLSFRR